MGSAIPKTPQGKREGHGQSQARTSKSAHHLPANQNQPAKGKSLQAPLTAGAPIADVDENQGCMMPRVKYVQD